MKYVMESENPPKRMRPEHLKLRESRSEREQPPAAVSGEIVSMW